MAEFRVSADPLETDIGAEGCLADGVGAEVGELAGLEVPPHRLDRVEIMAVGGQSFDNEPVSLGPQPSLSTAICNSP